MEFRDYLIKFDYPNINLLNEDEIANIFHVSNRIFLLSWIVRVIDPAIELEINSKETPKILADFVYENGFCSASQKDRFIRGEMNLRDQLIIMKKIFSSKIESTDNLSEQSIGFAALETYYEMKTSNVLRGLGSAKAISQKKINDWQKDSKEINKRIEEIRKQIEVENHAEDVTDRSQLNISNLQDHFRQSATYLHMNSSVLSQRKGDFHKSRFSFCNDKDGIKKTCDNLKTALKIMQNTKSIVDFPDLSKRLVSKNTSELFNETSNALKENAYLFNEIKTKEDLFQ